MIAFLLKNWKMILSGLILAILVGTIVVYKGKADSYMKDANALRVQNGQLQEQIDHAVEVNKENLDTLKQIQADAKTKDEVINSLNLAISKNKNDMASLRDQIKNTKPENNGPVANVLKDAIRGVQNAR